MSDQAELIVLKERTLKYVGFDKEEDLEQAVMRNAQWLFGKSRIYIDVKKQIKAANGRVNIPDGYLIDLNSSTPRLYIVENELERHDHLRHIAVQLLQFSLAFDESKVLIQSIIWSALNDLQKKQLEEYVDKSGFRNTDHLLHFLVYEQEFRTLVVIDEVPDGMIASLTEKFKFVVEIIEFSRYKAESGEVSYRFTPFLAEIHPERNVNANTHKVNIESLDTIVVPARETGFRERFIGESRWFKIRIGGTMRSQIKYIAAYQVAPISAITHVAPIQSIEPWEDSDKFVIKFSAPAKQIKKVKYNPKGEILPPQSIRYTNLKILEQAHTLDDLWG